MWSFLTCPFNYIKICEFSHSPGRHHDMTVEMISSKGQIVKRPPLILPPTKHIPLISLPMWPSCIKQSYLCSIEEALQIYCVTYLDEENITVSILSVRVLVPWQSLKVPEPLINGSFHSSVIQAAGAGRPWSHKITFKFCDVYTCRWYQLTRSVLNVVHLNRSDLGSACHEPVRLWFTTGC